MQEAQLAAAQLVSDHLDQVMQPQQSMDLVPEGVEPEPRSNDDMSVTETQTA